MQHPGSEAAGEIPAAFPSKGCHLLELHGVQWRGPDRGPAEPEWCISFEFVLPNLATYIATNSKVLRTIGHTSTTGHGHVPSRPGL